VRVEAIFLELKLVILPVEIADAVVLHSMAQNEILRTRGAPDGIRLDEPKPVHSLLERSRPEERIGNGMIAKIFEQHNNLFCTTCRRDDASGF
jgi:hypothetical protein